MNIKDIPNDLRNLLTKGIRPHKPNQSKLIKNIYSAQNNKWFFLIYFFNFLPKIRHSFGFSSELSLQSGSPSQTKLICMHCPSEHWNCLSLQGTGMNLCNLSAMKEKQERTKSVTFLMVFFSLKFILLSFLLLLLLFRFSIVIAMFWVKGDSIENLLKILMVMLNMCIDYTLLSFAVVMCSKLANIWRKKKEFVFWWKWWWRRHEKKSLSPLFFFFSCWIFLAHAATKKKKSKKEVKSLHIISIETS